MADDYTPMMNEIRADYVRDHTRNFDSFTVGRSLTSEQEFCGDQFDRALAVHDAQKRAEWEAGQVAELRAARAETWDEAISTVFAWWNAPDSERPALIVNPYGAGLPVTNTESEGKA